MYKYKRNRICWNLQQFVNLIQLALNNRKIWLCGTKLSTIAIILIIHKQRYHIRFYIQNTTYMHTYIHACMHAIECLHRKFNLIFTVKGKFTVNFNR